MAFRSSPWLVIRLLDPRGKTLRWPASDPTRLAAALRRGLSEACRREGVPDWWVAARVLGHGSDPSARWGIIPFPVIDRGRPSPHLSHVLLTNNIPSGQDAVADAAWAILPQMVGGLVIANSAGDDEGMRGLVARVSFNDQSAADPYVRPARHWATVTPLLYPRFGSPEQAIRLAFRHSGLDPDSDIASWSLAGKAERLGQRKVHVPFDYARVPRHQIVFETHNGIPGPLLLGRGRFYGWGLCVASTPA